MIRRAIKEELRRRGWTVYKLARESGVSKTTLYEYVRARREIESGALDSVCKVLQMRLVSEGLLTSSDKGTKVKNVRKNGESQ
jgi:transcriptional regulator with XRE-family HTH domain